MRTVLLFIALVLAFINSVSAGDARLRDGDIVFQTSRSSQSLAIQLATHSPYSHVGIVFIENGRPVVYEAVEPVSATSLDEWIARGEGGRFAVKRLRDAGRLLTPQAIKRMRAVAGGYVGKHYDALFGWSDDRMYCSELVWKVYRKGLGVEVGAKQRLEEFDLTDPRVKAKLTERYGAHIPLDEPVVSPSAIFDSPLLVNAPAH